MKPYEPQPIDLSDVTINEDLHELQEAIAENVHEVWAMNRRNEGWTYGPRRDDKLKQTPDMVPYSELTEQEKHYDRVLAENTIKLLKKLGYEIVKTEDTELYRMFVDKMRRRESVYHCPRCGEAYFSQYVFCPGCGKELK